MSSGLSRRLKLGIVLGSLGTGLALAQRTPNARTSAEFPAAGRVIKDCPVCPDLLEVPAGQFEDCYNTSYEGAPTDGRAWTTADCPRRVIRGGNWSHSPPGVRSANRNGDPPSFHNMIVGLRVARTLP